MTDVEHYLDGAEASLDAVRTYKAELDNEHYPGTQTVEEDFEDAVNAVERQLRIAQGILEDESEEDYEEFQ